MSLQQTIKDQMKPAMIAKDTVRLGVIRGLMAGFINELVAKNKNPQDALTDEETMAVVKKAVKQRKDSIEQFTKGGREDLAVDEKAELAILETFLPKMMGQDEIRKIAEALKTKMGVTDKAKMGQFIGTVMKETKGQADGMDVKAVVESLFQ